MIADPTGYRWSSCAALCGHRDDPLLTLHATLRALGASTAERGAAYRAILREALPEDELRAIRLHLQQQRAWGSDDFRAMVEAKTLRFAGMRPAHRPRREPS